MHTNPSSAALQQSHWRSLARLASFALVVEKFLHDAGFARAPWLAVGMAGGIAAWFALPSQWEWQALICGALGLALLAYGGARGFSRYPYVRQAIFSFSLMVAAGCGVVWAKSALVGTWGIAHPMAPVMRGLVLDRYDQPAEHRVRLVLAVREPGTGRAIRVRISVPEARDNPLAVEGSVVRLRARLMPPSPPRLPGAYDAARAAWFDGIAATGALLGGIEVLTPAPAQGGLAVWQHALSDHVHRALAGSAGGIAAAFASGDRGGITAADEQAMRDSGLTHLLSVSGLHVSAVVGGAYFLALRLLALWPWVALRVRLPVLASGFGGLTGVAYTLLTGAQVPTIRSCLGALLVLGAVALGRQPLSLRLLAVAACVVMLFWPEAVIGPSFQMSFGSVLAIIALHEAAPVRAFLHQRGDGWWMRLWRHGVMLLLAGMVIELALMPITFYFFHRAGVYGSLANLVAIPLTTFVTMPLIALALAADLVGLGHWPWWLCGQSLELLLAIARWTASRPDAITQLPTMGGGAYLCFLGGMLWLALWQGRVRLLGLIPAVGAAISLAMLTPPDVLITGDGQNVGILADDGRTLVMLRQGKSTFTRSAMMDTLGMSGTALPMDAWRGAQCNEGFCRVDLRRAGRNWSMLIARGKALASEKEMEVACASVDMVVARSKIFGPCHPRLLKADEPLLYRTGGLALYLSQARMATVAQSQGQHPWWRAPSGWPDEDQ
jgi:competence protein ComEC